MMTPKNTSFSRHIQSYRIYPNHPSLWNIDWYNIYIYITVNIHVIYTISMCIYIWGLSKIPFLFGRIGPLALRPCALFRAWGFLPHSINILQIPWWYDGDMVIWYVLRSPLRPLAQTCIFDASISCSQNPISPEDVIGRTGFFINAHICIYSTYIHMCVVIYDQTYMARRMFLIYYIYTCTESI